MPTINDFGTLSSAVLIETDQGNVSPGTTPVTVTYGLLIEPNGAATGYGFATVTLPLFFVKDAAAQDGSFDRGQPSSMLFTAQPAAGGSATGGVIFPTTQATTFVIPYDANPEWYKIDGYDTIAAAPTSWEGHYTTYPSPNTNHTVTNKSVTKLTPHLPETDGTS